MYCGSMLNKSDINDTDNTHFPNPPKPPKRRSNILKWLSNLSGIAFVLSVICLIAIISCKYAYLEKVEEESSSPDSSEQTDEFVTIYPFWGNYSPLTRGWAQKYHIEPSKRNTTIAQLRSEAYYVYQNHINELISDMSLITILVFVLCLCVRYAYNKQAKNT